MKSLKLLSVIAILSTLFLASCSDYSEQAKIIPENSSVVASVDISELFSKANIEEIEDFDFFQMFDEEVSNTSPEVKELFEELKSNPLTSGLNVLDDVYSFTYKDEFGDDYAGVSAGILSGSLFSDFVDKLIVGLEFEKSIIDKNGYKTVVFDENSFSLSWDSDKLLVLFSNSFKNFKKESDRLMIKDSCKSVVENENFKAFLDKDADISIWQNQVAGLDSTFNNYVNISLNDIYSHTYLNFENDQILISSESFYNDEIKTLSTKHNVYGEGMEESILKAMPQSSYLAYGFSVNFPGIYNFLKEVFVDFDDVENKSLLYTGLKLEDIFNSFNGDLVFNVSDFKIKETEYTTYEFDSAGNFNSVIKVREQLTPSIIATCYLNDDYKLHHH